MTTPLTKQYAGLLAGLYLQTTTITNTYAVDSGAVKDTVVLCNFSAGKVVTLPAPSAGRFLIFTDIAGTAAADNITLHQNASETINGATTYVLNQNKMTAILVSDGTNWFVISLSIPS